MWNFLNFPILSLLLLSSCFSLIVATITWKELSGYPGAGRHHPITFANETHGFLLTGSTEISPFTSDFYIYHEETDSWLDVSIGSAFPGMARTFGYGIVLPVENHPKAYVGFGVGSNGSPLGDLWEFDMVTHVWKRLADLPGLARLHPAMIPVLKNKNNPSVWEIHVGLGEGDGGNFNDWWSYSIMDDQWEQLSDFPSTPRHHPFYFGIADSAYAGLGHSDGRTIERDWFRMDASTRAWHREDDFASYQVDTSNTASVAARSLQPVTTEARVAGTQFSIELPLYGTNESSSSLQTMTKRALGFVLSGDGDDHSTMEKGEFHAFVPGGGVNSTTGWWMELSPHPGSSRWAPGSFVMRGTARAYFTSGFDRNSKTLYADLWLVDLTSLFELPWDNVITNPLPTPAPSSTSKTPEKDNSVAINNSSTPTSAVGLGAESSGGAPFLLSSLLIYMTISIFIE